MKDKIVYWDISLLLDDGGNGIYRLEWNLTSGKICFINEKGVKTSEYEQYNLRKIESYYSMAENVLADVSFHYVSHPVVVMFENKLCVNDFVKQAKAVLGDPENSFEYLEEETEEVEES